MACRLWRDDSREVPATVSEQRLFRGIVKRQAEGVGGLVWHDAPRREFDAERRTTLRLRRVRHRRPNVIATMSPATAHAIAIA